MKKTYSVMICRFPLLTVWIDTLNSSNPRFSMMIWFLWNAVKASWIMLVKSVGTVNHTTRNNHVNIYIYIGSTVKRRPYRIGLVLIFLKTALYQNKNIKRLEPARSKYPTEIHKR